MMMMSNVIQTNNAIINQVNNTQPNQQSQTFTTNQVVDPNIEEEAKDPPLTQGLANHLQNTDEDSNTNSNAAPVSGSQFNRQRKCSLFYDEDEEEDYYKIDYGTVMEQQRNALDFEQHESFFGNDADDEKPKRVTMQFLESLGLDGIVIGDQPEDLVFHDLKVNNTNQTDNIWGDDKDLRLQDLFSKNGLENKHKMHEKRHKNGRRSRNSPDARQNGHHHGSNNSSTSSRAALKKTQNIDLLREFQNLEIINDVMKSSDMANQLKNVSIDARLTKELACAWQETQITMPPDGEHQTQPLRSIVRFALSFMEKMLSSIKRNAEFQNKINQINMNNKIHHVPTELSQTKRKLLGLANNKKRKRNLKQDDKKQIMLQSNINRNMQALQNNRTMLLHQEVPHYSDQIIPRYQDFNQSSIVNFVPNITQESISSPASSQCTTNFQNLSLTTQVQAHRMTRKDMLICAIQKLDGQIGTKEQIFDMIEKEFNLKLHSDPALSKTLEQSLSKYLSFVAPKFKLKQDFDKVQQLVEKSKESVPRSMQSLLAECFLKLPDNEGDCSQIVSKFMELHGQLPAFKMHIDQPDDVKLQKSFLQRVQQTLMRYKDQFQCSNKKMYCMPSQHQPAAASSNLNQQNNNYIGDKSVMSICANNSKNDQTQLTIPSSGYDYGGCSITSATNKSATQQTSKQTTEQNVYIDL